MAIKNIPSNNPEYRRRKKVQKEFEQLLLDDGHGTLFHTPPVKPKARQSLARDKLILDAIKYNLSVPQSMRDEVNRPPDENPKVPDEDDGKAPW
ncbi:hypothetical protein SAMN06273572_108108 [Monaibacterium marinum]|uniref:Uncharacterized protein n=1 Tax=Pontivivens marinum TaxID=1690039 RepID=A0A2C9CV95_9RHOB|nr:hypothetical protein [Monaibacterium marinum]SOH95234.1 hypothetical protein SAMN06273572_108108 [Monaibacterium marinum]